MSEASLAGSGMLGSYRRAIGWTPETRAVRGTDQSFLAGQTRRIRSDLAQILKDRCAQ